MAAFLQVALESAIFAEKARYYMTVKLGHPDEQDPLNSTAPVHKTSLSSGHSESAIFNVHSFNIGDISATSPDTRLEFRAFKVTTAPNLQQELIGQFNLAIAQMRLQDFARKVRKSLGLTQPGKNKETGRFNLALVILED